MFNQIETILNSLGWAKTYLENFKANDMDDETVRGCFDSDLDPMNALAEVIPSSGHRLKFITAFHNKVFGNGSTDQIGGTGMSSSERNPTKVVKVSAASICGETCQKARTVSLKTLAAAKQEFTDGMERLFESVNNDENDLNDRATKLKSQVKAAFASNTRKLNMCKTCLNDHLSDMDATMDNLISQFKKMLAMKIKEDKLAVKETMANAKDFYSKQMETALKSKPWYPVGEFKNINDKVLQMTVEKLTKEAPLSPEQAKLLHVSLQGLHRKFEETNYSFLPTDSHAIGIDLGTTFSCVGVYVNGRVEIFQENEKFTIPSCVYFEKGLESRAVVGEAAQDGAFRSPENFIFDAKRLIGRNWDEQVVQDDIKLWNFDVVKVGDQPRIKCRAGVLRPEQVSAEVLAHLKALAERHLGQRVTNAVVTVPAYFNEGQRQATKDAAAMAGLTATIMTEPVAAAVAYRLEHTADSFENSNVLVFDLGGGTFDVAVLTISNWNINVKTINGDTHLGGEDFDKFMVKHVIEKIKAKTGKNPLKDKVSSDPQTRMKANNFIRRLKMECERKKRALSTAKMVHICLEEAGWNVDETMTQEEFEELINADLQKCLGIVDKALADAKLDKKDIQDIILPYCIFHIRILWVNSIGYGHGIIRRFHMSVIL